MLHNINPWTPLFSERRGGGRRAPKEREQVSKELTTAPPSFQLRTPPPLYTLIFSLFALYSALGADWPDHDGNQPGPSVKASAAIHPPPPGIPTPSRLCQLSPLSAQQPAAAL